MPSCIVRYCKNRTGKTNKCHGITFHMFPKHETRDAWIQFVQKNRSEKAWLPSDYTVICSMHFKDEDTYATKSGITRLKNTAVPCEKDGASKTTKMLRKSQNQREQYDPFREFANDSSDEELSDIKEELQDEGNSDDDKSEKSTATEKVFVQSIAYKGNQFGDGQRESKRARLETSEVPFDYTEELYEFGKYVAEQLMCLGVEDARIVQEEIKAVLSKNLNQMSCLEEPSTSYLKPTTVEHSTTVTQLVTQEKPVVSVKSSSQKNTAGPSVTLVKTVTKGSKVTSAGSKVNSAGSKVIQSGSQVNIAEPSLTQSGPSLASKLTKYAVLNVNSGESSISPFGYIVVPSTGALGAQSESGVSFGCPSLTEPRSSGPLFGTPVKVELEHQSSPSHVNVFMSSDTDTELLIVKSEADSEDET